MTISAADMEAWIRAVNDPQTADDALPAIARELHRTAPPELYMIDDSWSVRARAAVLNLLDRLIDMATKGVRLADQPAAGVAVEWATMFFTSANRAAAGNVFERDLFARYQAALMTAKQDFEFDLPFVALQGDSGQALLHLIEAKTAAMDDADRLVYFYYWAAYLSQRQSLAHLHNANPTASTKIPQHTDLAWQNHMIAGLVGSYRILAATAPELAAAWLTEKIITNDDGLGELGPGMIAARTERELVQARRRGSLEHRNPLLLETLYALRREDEARRPVTAGTTKETLDAMPDYWLRLFDSYAASGFAAYRAMPSLEKVLTETAAQRMYQLSRIMHGLVQTGAALQAGCVPVLRILDQMIRLEADLLRSDPAARERAYHREHDAAGWARVLLVQAHQENLDADLESALLDRYRRAFVASSRHGFEVAIPQIVMAGETGMALQQMMDEKAGPLPNERVEYFYGMARWLRTGGREPDENGWYEYALAEMRLAWRDYAELQPGAATTWLEDTILCNDDGVLEAGPGMVPARTRAEWQHVRLATRRPREFRRQPADTTLINALYKLRREHEQQPAVMAAATGNRSFWSRFRAAG